MKKKFAMLMLMMVCLSCTSKKEDNSTLAVEKAVEVFRQTMLQPDQLKFEELTSPVLTYGHSSGLIEDRATCIGSMVSGKFKFLSIDLTNQHIDIEGNTAIVRHEFNASTHDEGKPAGKVRLSVLQVWSKYEGHWHLIARQAVKI